MSNPTNFRALVSIAGIDLPEPATYAGNTSTIVDSDRNALGGFIGSVIRGELAQVDLSWRYLTAAQWAAILALFNIEAGGSYVNEVTFYNQAGGDWVTRAMYVSDRQAGAWRRNPENGDVMGFTECKLSLTEA